MEEVKFALGRKLNYFPTARWYYALIAYCPECKIKTLQFLGKDDKGHYIRCQCRACWEITIK